MQNFTNIIPCNRLNNNEGVTISFIILKMRKIGKRKISDLPKTKYLSMAEQVSDLSSLALEPVFLTTALFSLSRVAYIFTVDHMLFLNCCWGNSTDQLCDFEQIALRSLLLGFYYH